MERIFKRIKNRFQQLKKPTEKTQEILKLSLWIFGVYTCINLLPFINNLLISLPSGLFLVLLLNCVVIFYLTIKTFFHILVIKQALQNNNEHKATIILIYATSQVLFVGFNIYILYAW